MNWKHHASDITINLNRANALLFKIRNFVNVNTLKTIYYSTFDSHINYANVIWAQNFIAINRVFFLQKKALRTISFQPRDCHSSPLFKKQTLLKFGDKTQLKNVLLVSKYFNNILPSIFDKWLTHFAPKYIIITQLLPLHASYLNPRSELIYTEKFYSYKCS